jgi:gliding motility-associated-like protein
MDYKKKYSDSVVSAPIQVTFTNNSKNTVNYTWIFGDGDTVRMKEPENTPEPHVYHRANQLYKLKLIASSKEGCLREDTASITVAKSELDAPNVFTPNEDGNNDYFVIRNISMREFHLTIFTRSGRKVYEFQGPDINSWDGWDGKMGNTELTSGVYYYVLEAASFEQPSVKYKPTKYSGFFYLIR